MPTIANTLDLLLSQGLDRREAQTLILLACARQPHERAWLLTHDTDALATTALERLKTLVTRLQCGEPLAYLVGHQEFYGLTLNVDHRALVPRPDTETLVEWALELIAPKAGKKPRVLDLGTGSGAIALALKAAQPMIDMFAVDSSLSALSLAQVNAKHLDLNVSFFLGSWFDAVTTGDTSFQFIVSNPPYIAEHDPHLSALASEPMSALTSGVDGLDDLRHIIERAPHHLNANGWLVLEHGYDQAVKVRQLLRDRGFSCVQSRRDLSDIERCSGGCWIPDEPGLP